MAATYAADELKLRAVMLDVAGAFHSPLMAPAAARLGDALAGTSIEAPACPVLANVTGLPHEADPESIRNRLIEQLTNPTRWSDCMSYYKSNPDVTGEGDWIELAPGKTLTGVMKKCDRSEKSTGSIPLRSSTVTRKSMSRPRDPASNTRAQNFPIECPLNSSNHDSNSRMCALKIQDDLLLEREQAITRNNSA